MRKNITTQRDVDERKDTIGMADRDTRLDDAVCLDIDVDVPTSDEDEDLEPNPLISPPTLTVVSEVVGSNGEEEWVNLTVSYEAIDGYEYEFEIIEAD